MKLYFMGICGTAMGNAALLARASGHEVCGADAGVYPPMSDVLAAAGISVLSGYDAGRLEQLAPDLVVVGNAMTRGNPEIEWLLDRRRFRFTSLPAMLNEFVLDRRTNIVVCGTHGKTTTTALAAFLLRAAGHDPGFLIGGVPVDPPVGSHLGSAADPFVIEGDEYDSAFFDKRSKFIHYAPRVAVLNNLEFDHADIFRDLADVQRSFNHLARIVPRNGCIVVNGDDDNLRGLAPITWTSLIRVGTGASNDVRLLEFEQRPDGSRFRLDWRGRPWGEVSWGMSGEFNARNAAMAATAVAAAICPHDPDGVPLAALAGFRGVRRRQEVVTETPQRVVIEDFGHHPTAIAETLLALRGRYPDSVLTAVFEPRSNTARTRALQAGFMRALAQADEVYIGAVNRADKIAVEQRFDSAAVAQHLETQGIEAHAAESNDLLLDRLAAHTGTGGRRRVVVFFTNGSFDGIVQRYARLPGPQNSA